MAVNGKRAFRIEGICAAVFIKIQGVFTGDSRREIWNKYIQCGEELPEVERLSSRRESRNEHMEQADSDVQEGQFE